MKVAVDLAGTTSRHHNSGEPVADLVDDVFDFHWFL
jgi:hypothetical protein